LLKRRDRAQQEKGTALAVPFHSSLVVVTERSVVEACSHATVLEIAAQTRTDTDLCVLAFRVTPCQSEPLAKPRLTLVWDGNPLRRLLLRSKKNSVFTAVSPFWMDLPVTSRRGNCISKFIHPAAFVPAPHYLRLPIRSKSTGTTPWLQVCS
jgi:hypothetical protein